jgi:hypothetical protein
VTGSISGVVGLHLPADWCDLILGDDADADARFTQLARRTWPSGSEQLWAAAAGALRAWRERLVAGGAVSHGVVSAMRPDGTAANWHILTSVVVLPSTLDIDLSALMVRLVQARFDDLRHVEQFETDLGLGVGLIAEPTVFPPPGLPGLVGAPVGAGQQAVRMGMAAALACAPGAEQGLLVVGVTLEAGQVAELAALVALIAGRSRLRPVAAPSVSGQSQ